RVLRDRRVAHALLAELVEQPGGHLERAVEDADVFAHQHHRLVAVHLLAQRLVERLAVAEDGHQSFASSAGPGPISPAWWLYASPPEIAMSRSSSPRCGSGERSSTEYQPRTWP